jgi:hypothetical protein
MTMSVVLAEVLKGITRNSVANAVERVLAPLFREYERAWNRFQKSERTALPTLSTVWECEKAKPHVATYLALSAMPALVSAASGTIAPKPPGTTAEPGAAATAAATLKAKNKEIGELKKALADVKREVAGGKDDESGKSSQAKKRERQKKEREEKETEIADLKAKLAAAAQP